MKVRCDEWANPPALQPRLFRNCPPSNRSCSIEVSRSTAFAWCHLTTGQGHKHHNDTHDWLVSSRRRTPAPIPARTLMTLRVPAHFTSCYCTSVARDKSWFRRHERKTPLHRKLLVWGSRAGESTREDGRPHARCIRSLTLHARTAGEATVRRIGTPFWRACGLWRPL